jgi:hypothetical protein
LSLEFSNNHNLDETQSKSDLKTTYKTHSIVEAFQVDHLLGSLQLVLVILALDFELVVDSNRAQGSKLRHIDNWDLKNNFLITRH